jgi:hypothetical protein
MDHILFIAAVIAAVIAVVAFLIALGRKHARAKKLIMLNAYQAVLTQNDLKPDLVDEFSHRIIGLDTAKNIFVAVRHEGDHTPATVIPLSEVTDCSLKKSGHSVSVSGTTGKSMTEEFTNSIALLFHQRNGSPVEVPVYSEIQDGIGARVDLAQTAEKWQQLVRVAIGRVAQ